MFNQELNTLTIISDLFAYLKLYTNIELCDNNFE